VTQLYSVQVKCPGGTQCVWQYAICDGNRDCGDGSDEDPDFCRASSCGLWQVQYRTVLCKVSTVQYSTVLYGTAQCSSRHHWKGGNAA